MLQVGVSRAYLERSGYQPDYLATIDAVFGLSNRNDVDYYGIYKANWYQDNGIDFINYACPIFEECRIDDFISCGDSMEGRGFNTSTKVNSQHDGHGSIKRGICLGRSSMKKQAHVTIDEDGLIHQAIVNYIEEDVQQLYDRVMSGQVPLP